MKIRTIRKEAAELMKAECCGKVIDLEEYTLNHGMCDTCMDKGVEEANKRQGYHDDVPTE